MTLGLIILIILGGSVSVAAENSLPGDALYSIKTNINENVRSMVEVSIRRFLATRNAERVLFIVDRIELAIDLHNKNGCPGSYAEQSDMKY